MTDRARILLLEDDPDMRETLAEVLDEEGYDVHTASSGGEAVDRAAASSYDLMITDVRMAGMDGLEALARVKQSLPDVASLVITGYAGDADSIRALRLGAGDYLRKPFELADFLSAVERILARRRQELARRARERSLLQLALGALETVAHNAQQHQALRAGRLAWELGRELGLDPDLREETRIATLLATLRHVSGIPALLHHPSLSPAIRRILRALDEDSAPGAAAPIEAKIAAAAVGLATGHLLSNEELDARLGEAVETVLARIDDDEIPDDEDETQDRQLVSLACALEAVGDREAAERAFETVARRPRIRRDTVDAGLGWARVAGAAGRFDDVEARLDEAVEQARAVGPTTHAHALLEAGLLWTRLGHGEAARPRLEQAIALLDELHAQPGPMLARLALADPAKGQDDPERVHAVDVLARPEFTSDLVAATPWLFPRLATMQGARPDPLVERLLGRMVREVPREVARLFERGTLGVEARRAAVRALIGENKAPLAWVPSVEHDEDAEVRRLARTLLPEGVPEEGPPMLRIHSLGALEAWLGDVRVPDSAWVSSKIKFVFAYLAASNGADVPEDLLIERFWPGDVERGRRSLYNAKAVLTRCLQPAGARDDLKYVVRQRGMLRLDSSLPCWHDVQEVESLAVDASRLQHSSRVPEMLEQYRRMVALYRGPYLDGCYMDWALEYRTRLERLVSTALGHLLENALARRQPQEAIDLASRLLDIDPCRQEAHMGIMQAHLVSGHPEQAVRQFEVCRRRLQADLELEPSIALIEMHQRARLALGSTSVSPA